MQFNLAFWLISFTVEAALLGLIMYALVALADLENDFINPFDSSSRVNKTIIPEMIFQILQFVLILVGSNWSLTIMHLPLLFWILKVYFRGGAYVDVTEIFSHLSREKKVRFIKLGFHLMMFVCIIYKLVEASVTVLMEQHGATITKTLMTNVGAKVPRVPIH
mmetsp:Transcript_28580/g.39478  ORF Transcript_28580/g.39478 Transcript_28580/m.39478 type:complete len:163 (-) Transcript_28580:91-579(-)